MFFFKVTSSKTIAQSGTTVIIPCGPPNESFNDTLIIWKKSGVVVNMINKGRILINKSKIVGKDILLENVQKNDSAVYNCKVNSNEPESFDTNLEVYDPPAVSLIPNLKILYAKKGEPVSVQCLADSLPDTPIFWSKKDSGDSTLQDMRLEHNKLAWSSVDFDAKGLYECKAVNGFGESRGKITIIVHSAPTLDAKPYVNGALEKMMTITCKFRATPAVNVTWFKDNVPVQIDTGTLIQAKNFDTEPNVLVESSLIIERTQKGDFDSIFTCLGVNPLGSVSGNFTVKGIPEIVTIIKIEDIAEDNGDNSAIVDFSTVSHTPLFEFKLFISEPNNGKFLKEIKIPANSKLQDHYQQTFKMIGLGSNKEYEVDMVAKNEHGWSERTAKRFSFLTNSIKDPLNSSRSHHTRNIFSSAGSRTAMPLIRVTLLSTFFVFILAILL
ncbi:unnamed protein product [Gordionus sp. m RMFG-2023]